MATLSVIRRWALREHLSLREIARRTGLSRNTIKKYLRAGEAEPRYTKRVGTSKLDPFAEKLSGWLKTESNSPPSTVLDDGDERQAVTSTTCLSSAKEIRHARPSQ